MPPKPQVFKSPDGREFTSRAEWRDYMMLTFYSFKNKVNEPAPLIKEPGSIGGQMFDIADCENSTLAVLDQSEQVQIDQCKNCRIMVTACASSIFIRNCENCVFYTCCRQLRLRDAVNCTFYIYSMAEVHIEFSKGLKFAPFNGGYPQHADHMRQANLDISHNLWYDIYDHNDPAKTRANWALLPEADYEQPWFPLGPCEPAVPRTKPCSVHRTDDQAAGSSMQSFSLQQMMADAQKIASPAKAPPAPPAATAADVTAPPAPPAAGSGAPCCGASAGCSAGAAAAPSSSSSCSPADKVKCAIKSFLGLKAGDNIGAVLGANFRMILPTGQTLTAQDLSAAVPAAGRKLWSVDAVNVCGDTPCCAYASYWATEDDADLQIVHCTAVVQKCGGAENWTVSHVHKSFPRPASEVPKSE